MSEFITSITEIMTEEEANSIMADALLSVTEDNGFEHGMLVDSVQILALGGLSLGRVAGHAVTDAKLAGYGTNRVYDLFTENQLRYGKHVFAVTQDIKSGDSVTSAMEYAGSYLKSRMQIQINSELMTSLDGRKYYEFIRRDHYVTSNVYTSWKFHEEKTKVKRTMKLYVKDLANGKFYVEKNGVRTAVALGTTEAYNVVLNAILATGVVQDYEAILNNIPQGTVEVLADHQQRLFLTVFKTLKASLNPIA